MKLVRPFLLLAASACVLSACAANVRQSSDSNGAGAGTGGESAGTGGGSAGSGAEQGPFVLSSPAFTDMGSIGAQYDCGATGVSPPLSWTAGPAGTHSYAIVMVGPGVAGADSLYHWVIWDIPAGSTSLPEAVAQLAMPPVPAGSSQISTGTDGVTWPGYSGPCSILQMAYTFTVFALDLPVLPGVTLTSTGADVFAAIQANSLASARLTVLASHYKS